MTDTPVESGPVELANVELDWTPVFEADDAGRGMIDRVITLCCICFMNPASPKTRKCELCSPAQPRTTAAAPSLTPPPQH